MIRSPAPRSQRIEFLGLAFDSVTVNGAVDRFEEWIRGRFVGRIACVNVALLMWTRSSPALQEIYRRCDLLVADGMGIYYGSRLLGQPTPGITNAVLLMDELLKRAATNGYRLYLLGTTGEILERALVRLRERHPELLVVGHRDGFFSRAEEDEVVRGVVAARPDILLIGISSVRKDEFLDRQLSALGIPVCLGVGGAIDVLAGVYRIAPHAVRRAGLEWLYRLAQEPQRLWRRYLTTNAAFGVLLGQAFLRRLLPGLRELEGTRD
ncbi:MAG: WecB/TagA/CpsF family glycosyltransferase [Chloroflexota bacterium]|nr:WecB/TagA/CpsF family glycosyltransferase [Chloroflexota bacterium]